MFIFAAHVETVASKQQKIANNPSNLNAAAAATASSAAAISGSQSYLNTLHHFSEFVRAFCNLASSMLQLVQFLGKIRRIHFLETFEVEVRFSEKV